MPRVIECANLALVVYGPPKDKTQRNSYRSALTNLRLNWALVNDKISSSPSINAPFYAELWLHHSKREAIIGFRGTEINVIDNDIVDAKAWWSDALGEHKPERSPQYLKQAIWFTQDCKKYLAQHAPEAKLYFTGHSLGDAIAELMTTKERDISVAFNSPGIGHIKGVNTRLAALIHNINSRYGYINKVGKVIGSVDYVDVPEGEKIAKIGYQAYDDFKTRFNEENHLSPISIKFTIDAYHEQIDKKIISFGFSQSAYPQHSMKNLLSALIKSENNAVANRLY